MPPRPLPTIAGVVRCTVTGRVNGGARWANIWHARYAGGASAPGPTEITALDGVLTRIYSGTAYTGGTPWLTYCRTDTTVDAINYTPLDGSSVTTVVSKSLAGAAASQGAPAEVAIVLTLRTNHRGRRYRGRIYLPAPATTNLSTGGLFTSTPGILAQAEGARAALPALQWALGVASYGYAKHKDGTVVTWTPFFTDLLNFTMDQVPDVQRRRKS